MYTYGYLREAVMAHCDLEEDELQAMNVLKRLHIYANEAVQAICACKPNYKYFKAKVVDKYNMLLKRLIDNEYIEITEMDILGTFETFEDALEQYQPKREYVDKYIIVNDEFWTVNKINDSFNWIRLSSVDEITQREYYIKKSIYLVGEEIKMPDGFIAFTNKQTFIVKRPERFSYEDFVNGRDWTTNEAERWEPVNYNKDIMFVGQNSVKCLKEGEFMIPYKCVWFIFNSAQPDTTEIDIPIDVFNCLPLYIASEVLQIDYAQKAQIKRSEFEMALSRIIVTNNMPVNRIMPSF